MIWQHALADLRNRYAGTGLGVVWNVLHPLALIAVFSLVFSVFMEAHVPGVPGRFGFLLYLCSGLLPWLSFSETITRGASAFSDNAAYLKKLPIPEQVFVAQAAASATMGLAISFSILLAVSLLLNNRPTALWLLLPLPLIALQLLGFGIGLLCGTLNVFFRDVGQIVAVVLQVAMWTVPVVYVAERQSPSVRAAMQWHPVFPALAAGRDLFLSGTMPPPWVWGALIAWPALVLTVAGLTFARLRREIRDVL